MVGLEMEGSHSTTTTNLAAEKMMMVMVNGVTKERRTRARRPKVKTGCSVCKIRRVKCDETKPYAQCFFWALRQLESSSSVLSMYITSSS